MSTYKPDRWVILEFNFDGEIIKKVFAGWYGGYTQGDSWKLSSGVVEEKEFDDRFEFVNYSGSIYICYRNLYGMSGYMTDLFTRFHSDIKKSINNGEIINIKLLKEYEKKIH